MDYDVYSEQRNYYYDMVVDAAYLLLLINGLLSGWFWWSIGICLVCIVGLIEVVVGCLAGECMMLLTVLVILVAGSIGSSRTVVLIRCTLKCTGMITLR